MPQDPPPLHSPPPPQTSIFSLSPPTFDLFLLRPTVSFSDLRPKAPPHALGLLIKLQASSSSHRPPHQATGLLIKPQASSSSLWSPHQASGLPIKLQASSSSFRPPHQASGLRFWLPNETQSNTLFAYVFMAQLISLSV